MIARNAVIPSLWYRLLLIGSLITMLSGYAFSGSRRLDSFAFTKAEIPIVLKSLSDVSGTNIVIGPAVKGEITLALKNVTVEEVLQIVTQMSGLSYTVMNETYVVNVAEPTKLPDTPVANASGYVLVKLENIPPADAIIGLDMAFKDVMAKMVGGRLMLSGAKQRVKDAEEFIKKIDVESVRPAPIGTPTELQPVEEIFRLKTVVPWQAKLYLEGQYASRGLTINYAPNTDIETTGVAPLPAGQWESKTLVLRGPKKVVEETLATLAKFDIEKQLIEKRVSTKRIFATQGISYLLERYESRGLSVLTAPMTPGGMTQIIGKNDNPPANGAVGMLVKRDKDGKLNVSEPVGDFILSGPEDVIKEAEASLLAIDVGPDRVEHIFNLRFLRATAAKDTLEKSFATRGLQVELAPARRGVTPPLVSESGGNTPAVEAAADPSEVSDLILRGPEPTVIAAEDMLRSLDSEPAQISIGSEIVSINSSEIKNLGIQWGGVAEGKTTVGTINVGLDEQPSGDPLQLGRIIRNPLQLAAVLNALTTRNKAKIVNRPTTVVQNGRKAYIHVGDEIFYETITGYSDKGPIYSVSSINTGVTLEVKPMASKDGMITLEITSSVTEPPTFHKGSSGADLPSFKKSANSTTVQIPSGETLVIGGLMQTSMNEVRSEVPVLGRLPIIGALFRNKTVTPSQTELLIMVKPMILTKTDVAETPATEIK